MPGYEQWIVRGARDTMRGFVYGWAAGRGFSVAELEHRLLWASDWPLHRGSLLAGLAEALRRGDAEPIFVRDDTTAPLLQAITTHAATFKLEERRRVLGARFGFQYEIFARAEAAEVRALFANLPEGVALAPGYDPEESVDPSARGTEMYAPAHSYALRAGGTVRGDLGAVLQFYVRTRQHERIVVKEIHLDLAP